jgi:heme exporter protein C
MGEAVRLFYVHVPVAILLSVMCFVATLSSAMWLRRRTPGWDGLAVASAEIALLYGVLTLGTGAIWGKPTWGTYWTWDPRLTTSALLVVIIFGYHALRRVDPSGGAEGSVPAALVGLLLFPNAILVRYSVDWWRSLHQDATINTLDPRIEGDMHLAAFLGVVVFGMVTVWLMVHRFRVSYLEKQALDAELATAVAERRAELVEGDAGEAAEDDNPVEGQ